MRRAILSKAPSSRCMKAGSPDRRLRGLGLAVLLGVIGLGGWVLWDSRNDAWKHAQLAAANLVHALEHDIERNIHLYDLSLQGTMAALKLPGLDAATPEVRQMALFDRAASAEYLGSVLVLGPDGRPTAASTSLDPPAIDLSDRDYFRAHQESPDVGLFVSRPFRSRLRGGDPGIAISRRLNDASGDFAGVVVGTLRLAYFQSRFGALDMGKGGAVTVFRLDGRVIARHPHNPDEIDRDLSGASTVQNYMTRRSGSFVGTGALDGVARMYTFRRVGDVPLVVSVATAMEDIFAAWRMKAIITGTTLLSLLAALVTLWVLLRREMRRRTEAEKLLLQAANTDALTGLSNRRSFDAALEREWSRALREELPISLILLDVDHFKLFNDEYGHPAGDACLRSVAQAVRSALRRPGDEAFRYGGEEIAILLPNTEEAGALHVGEAVRRAIRDLALPHRRSPSSEIVSASFGSVTTVGSSGLGKAGPEFLVASADRALYEAKRRGRDRLLSWNAVLNGQRDGARSEGRLLGVRSGA